MHCIIASPSSRQYSILFLITRGNFWVWSNLPSFYYKFVFLVTLVYERKEFVLNFLKSCICSRFIINIPADERKNIVRICFQIEIAHWFYLDFYCTENPQLKTCTMKEFTILILKVFTYFSEVLSWLCWVWQFNLFCCSQCFLSNTYFACCVTVYTRHATSLEKCGFNSHRMARVQASCAYIWCHRVRWRPNTRFTSSKLFRKIIVGLSKRQG